MKKFFVFWSILMTTLVLMLGGYTAIHLDDYSNGYSSGQRVLAQNEYNEAVNNGASKEELFDMVLMYQKKGIDVKIGSQQ